MALFIIFILVDISPIRISKCVHLHLHNKYYKQRWRPTLRKPKDWRQLRLGCSPVYSLFLELLLVRTFNHHHCHCTSWALVGEVHLTPQNLLSETTPKPSLWYNLFQNMPSSCSTNRKQDLQTIEGHSMSRFFWLLLLLLKWCYLWIYKMMLLYTIILKTYWYFVNTFANVDMKCDRNLFNFGNRQPLMCKFAQTLIFSANIAELSQNCFILSTKTFCLDFCAKNLSPGCV